MEWERLSRIDAHAVTDIWQQKEKDDFDAMVSCWDNIIREDIPKKYLSLRDDVVNAYFETKKVIQTKAEYRKRKDYYTDLMFGLRLYQIMEQYKLGVRNASNDQVWIFLCVRVFPDIVYDRFPRTTTNTSNESEYKNVNEDRYWNKRIYLKTIWWYIHLSIQNEDTCDLKLTFKTLERNTTDEIVQLVERPGLAGYRVEVCREIMKYYSEHRAKYDNSAFRKVMVLNTAKTKVLEPALVDGGISEYVKELFEYVS